MSAAAKKSNNGQPALVTTGRGAAFAITLGVTLLALGLTWLISLFARGESYVLGQMNKALTGLCGRLCPLFPVLISYAGIKLLVSARHRVAVRDVALLFGIYAAALAFYTLIARVEQAGTGISLMDYVGKVNYRFMDTGYDGYAAYLNRAYVLGTSGAGGMLGMAAAYPVWRIFGPVLGVMLLAAALIVMAFVLFRVNPGDFFRSASERSDRRQAKREARQLQREQQAASQAEQAAQEAPAPVVKPIPMEQTVPGQRVYRDEGWVQPEPVSSQSYEPSPYAPPREEQGFYPVQNDLYDVPIPVRETPAQRSANRKPVAPVVQQPAPKPEPAATKPAAPVAPVIRPEPAPVKPVPVPVQPEKPVDKPARPEKAPPQPLREEPDADDVPWETPKPEEHITVREKPVSPSPAPAAKPAAPKSDWAAQVRSKAASLEKADMPEHTTQKGEPKPVYTDPAVPITGERIPISPRPAAPRADARLDGTSAPKVRQGGMQLPIRYEAPPIRLLNESRHVPQQDAAQEDERRAQIIESTLASFGVESQVRQIMHGPSITRFAIQIAPGVKVSRVTTTADNLALDLKAKNVRVEAPIQGTSYIGIEVPNALVSTVALREVLDSPEMQNNPSPLLVALGKDIAGAPVLCDLSKMPHLLIAGATGSGKSVCINSIVCSLLYRTSPDQVRLIMIDPKQVELNVYNGIPHLLVPVVSDPRKAAGALSWVVQEMMERYGKFSEQNVRNLAGYNKANQGTDKVLPNIVVIIDEMADLMEVCRKDVEESIRRLAALARAAGIYMVLATQRPSVDVITGVIKNNIPSRIAFAVSSGTDSRTIIDINGAEKLMGKGDMLYKPAGTSPLRVQGCLVTDDEVNAVASYISSRYQADYDPNVIEHLEAAVQEKPEADEVSGYDEGPSSTGSGMGEMGFQELLQQAIEMAVEDGQSSTSMLQRRLRVGYARAGRLIDEMEKRGIISASEGSKPRKTLITREQYDALFNGDQE